MTRREALKRLVVAGASLPILAGCERTAEKGASEMPPKPNRMPSIFLAHGSPFLLDDTKWVGELNAWAKAMPRPKAVLMVSAHWEEKPVTLGATTTVPLVYDFYGFPQKYYEVTYAAPGAPQLATRVKELLKKTRQVQEEPDRGLDHGAYVPMVAMYPGADVPVLQLSLPTMQAEPLFEMGRALAPLRDEGVLIIGSGFLTHNLRAPRTGTTPSWAAKFDEWAADALEHRKVDELLNFTERAPGLQEALPTFEHFVPVLVAAGADEDARSAVKFPITGFMGGSFTRRSVQYG
ncbi:MAG: dioxygenase [Planctomycetes bacterium]|nr:dioxygenase [Planctomycetota bacterium]